MLRGCEDSELREMHLQRSPSLYSFTRQGAGLSVSRRRAPRAQHGPTQQAFGSGSQGLAWERVQDSELPGLMSPFSLRPRTVMRGATTRR